MKYYFLFILSFLVSNLWGQEMAITQSGDTIFVFNDGTWSYDREAKVAETSPPSTLEFAYQEVSIDSTFRVLELPEVLDKVINKGEDFYSLQYDSKSWQRVPPASINPAATYTFSDESQNIFAMVIAEAVEIGTENVYKFALQNAEENIGSSPKVINAGWVKVNGREMINAQYNIDMNGLKFTFNSLFYSSELGTIQFMTWTFTNLFEEKKSVLDGILAGLSIK